MAEKATSNKEHPLVGVVLCLTSVLPEQRTELATIASQMGAIHKFDLTSDVTHLLVGETNTPKYKFVARERPDVKVLKPEWIQALRESWMQGGDTDLRTLEEQYKLPTFSGLSICITGFEDMALRNYLEDTATAHGAEFRKDLTKSVTHLVSRNTEGQKYKFATQWNIKVVTMKWFNDSIERGMVLEETLYHPLLPAEQQGAGAWNRSIPTFKKTSSAETVSNPRPRKLRRMASAKLEHQNENIWGDIVGTGFEGSDPKKPKTNQQSSGGSAPAKNRPVLQEAKSFASATTFADATEAQPGPRKQSPEAAANSHKGFLHDCYFFIFGFSSKQTSVLRQHLTFNGAQIVGSLSDFSHPDIPKTGHGLYIVVSHKTPRTQVPSTDDMAFECEVVTDMWLERCLDAKAFVSPESHVANTPVPGFPIPGFQGLKICSTGFVRIDLLHLSKLVNLIGASYNEYMTQSSSVLVCNDPRSVNQDKLRHASEWGVPAVSGDWLWDSIQASNKKPFEPYMVRKLFSQNDKGAEKRQNGSRSNNTSQGISPRAVQEIQCSSSEIAAVKENTPAISRSKTIAEKRKQPSDEVAQNALQEKQPNPQKRATESIPHSKSPSPQKDQSRPNTSTSPLKRQETDQSAASAFDLAVSGLLKQAQASSRSATDSRDQSDQPRARRRKPLLGRATSLNSTRTFERSAFSRASSIDTLNEDGCGSGAESVATDKNTTSRVNSHGEQSFTSLFSGTRLEFGAEGNPEGQEDENEEPPMTQLNYEDPDAVAMRQKFLQNAGKLVDTEPANQGLVVGEVRELEDVGWGTGRRTRGAAKPADDLEY
ncbi:BRCT domain protein [Aspergillus chevalieri]|uniref:BRCT domain-containing protein n=1 Tax=Aspergillus chevalieri TaxID=182096 RepID=A0A7R7ZQT9_ASPCH|nr:uncharacterized protein ACHE_51172S [Aspergillus chevalieri]BCR89974.1 hypothetical protein ACHE_51172S [Aspergillus chevalieri]